MRQWLQTKARCYKLNNPQQNGRTQKFVQRRQKAIPLNPLMKKNCQFIRVSSNGLKKSRAPTNAPLWKLHGRPWPHTLNYSYTSRYPSLLCIGLKAHDFVEFIWVYFNGYSFALPCSTSGVSVRMVYTQAAKVSELRSCHPNSRGTLPSQWYPGATGVGVDKVKPVGDETHWSLLQKIRLLVKSVYCRCTVFPLR